MADTAPERDRADTRARAALAALARYRERRARDGGDTDGIECLVQRARVAEDEAERHRRRIELVDRAVHEDGIERALAEEVYDLAREEGVEPAFAFELVRCGVAVRELGAERPEAEAVARGYPSWVQALPEMQARRERLLRSSFRRLRALLERHASPEDALVAFAREPDVGEVKYP